MNTPVTSTVLDFNHPLFLHPSDTPGNLLVSHQLLGIENYNIWSRSMRIALLAKNKLGFVDGACNKESYTEDLHPQWERCNAIVLSWILNTVSKELSAGIVFASSAALVWIDLKERFDKVDGSRIYFLHREISLLTQGTNSVSTYFTRLKLLWDEFSALVPFASCTCEVSDQNSKHHAQQRLFQFLMGLNDTYSAVRSQILLLQPLPSVNQAYSIIIQEESQRLHSSGVSPLMDISAMYSNVPNHSDRRRFNGICDHCKIRGHKRENCYRLVGFPSDFKFTKKKGNQVALAVHNSTKKLENEDTSLVAPSFTQEQYN